MKGLAIYTIVALGIFFLGMLYNMVDGTITGYSAIACAMLIPIMIFAIMYVYKYK